MKKSLLLGFIFFFFLISCSDETAKEHNKKLPEKEVQEPRKDISFTVVSSEHVVEVGEFFQIVYKINENISDFTKPNFGVIDIMSGPSRSNSSTTEIINGSSARKISNLFIYVASCSEPGEHVIPEAEVTLDGHTYKSNSIKIKVIGNDSSEKSNKNVKAPEDDIFIMTSYSDTEIYNGGYIIATTKIYTKTDFSNISEIKFPDYEGFWIKTLQAPRQIKFVNELINGEKYSAALLKQTMIFAQKPGRYDISQYAIDVQVKKKDGKGRNRYGEIVDTYKLINKKLSAKKQTVIVKPLPQPSPDNFSGITGKEFNILAHLDSGSFGAEESTNLKITISGIGNIHLLNDFTLKLPDNLESFKPEIDNNESYSELGAYGECVFNYVIVAKDQGKFTIDPIEFVYFDSDSEKYETVSSEKFNLTVGSGISSANSNKEDKQIIDARDIRYIKETTAKARLRSSGYFGTIYYYLTFFLLSILFALFILFRNKISKANADVTTVRRKKASKVSQKRLKNAKVYLDKKEAKSFYKEILNAIWGYLSDKLSVSADELTKEQISKILADKNISSELIDELQSTTEICGYAQYSPDTLENSPENVYKATQIIINKFEEIL